ncbi:cytochrome b/b6 domain-containing protein [Sphingomonas sp.]|jgi:Ni/Fe-hydrogenase b-type cytochrome subunit|uniref:cytochrome b/b6 domain-containing protein n=1 Tax=Sphingomonas sp. TaxID=28214 RepID=UPI002E2F4DA5|nr:cytochrome b/b6 domain-containing protein [Sphingomonas sp.]HEX4695740.1 cytochrome b/b6 domain-containing protein [Sphingomonas sp.]
MDDTATPATIANVEEAAQAPQLPQLSRTVYRHRLATRLWHWVNAITIFVMIGSGLTILNAHPHLYWGRFGANFDQPWLDLPHWPGWVTIPAHYNLALARRWHLTFALVLGFGLLVFMVASLINRHFQRNLRVRAKEVAPRHLLDDAIAHTRFDFHNPDDPAAYNTLQKLSYVSTIFVLIPLMIFTGLAMSPAMDAAWPWLLEIFGGRQSARSIHFIAAALLVGFVVVHLALVILAGPFEETMSMITGRWKLPPERGE